MPIRPPIPWERTAKLLRTHCRRPDVRGVGLEIERIGMWEDGRSLHYTAQKDRPGAEQVLVELGKRLNWPVANYSEKFALGLQGTLGKVSLEPGSQLEFSANPQLWVGDAAKAVNHFETETDKVTAPWGIQWIGLGLNPVASVDQMEVIPLTRYRIMTDYLSKTGTLGTTMMRLTSSIQVNFDYASESEAIEMLRVGLAATPLSYALFGNSPISQGKPNGWLSFRSEVWRHMDPDRSGLMPEAFESGFSFDRYAELVWKRPLMFVQNKEGQNVESNRKSLAHIAAGELENCEVSNENELNTLRQLFTEARLKPGYVEVRSIDGLRVYDRYAAVAWWTGIIYGKKSRERVLEIFGALSPGQLEDLWVAAGREGLRARAGGVSLLEAAKELLGLSRETLLARGYGGEKFLGPVEKNIQEGKNPADHLLALFNGPWKGNMAELIRYCASRSA